MSHCGTKGGPIQKGYEKIDDMKKEVKKPKRTAWEKATWISEATWRLADQRKDLRQRHTSGQ